MVIRASEGRPEIRKTDTKRRMVDKEADRETSIGTGQKSRQKKRIRTK
jgi:hypothetical protein